MRKLMMATVAAAMTWAGGAVAQAGGGVDTPAAPAGLVPSFNLPGQDEGGWITPNRGLSAGETVWHLRVALNVAALSCRGPGEATMVAGYNALLASEKAAFVVASDTTIAAHKADGAGAYDAAMTKLYNFWAQPASRDGFCAVADQVLQDAGTVEPSDFGAFAATALPRLEAPFLRFCDAAAAYRTAMATRRDADAPQLAAVAP